MVYGNIKTRNYLLNWPQVKNNYQYLFVSDSLSQLKGTNKTFIENTLFTWGDLLKY